jgi:hypothetical protein
MTQVARSLPSVNVATSLSGEPAIHRVSAN